MKILMILSKEYIFDPRVNKEAKALVEAGHQVTILVWDRKGSYEPESNLEGIRVIRLRNTCIMKIVPNDLFRNPLWWRAAYKKGLHLYKNGFNYEVVHCHDLDTLQTGIWLKRKLGVKLIYDAHEIFSYMLKNNVSNFVVHFADKLEKRLIEQTDHVITVDDGYADYFRNITTRQLTIVRNCKELIGDYQPPSHKIFTLMFIGTLNPLRFFPQMLHVVGKIKNVQLFIIAKKEDRIYEEIKNLSKKFDNIFFFDPIPTSKVLSVTCEGHALIYFLDPLNIFSRIGSPNKLFEAMVTGRPIIVTKGTHIGDIVEQEQCGLVVDHSEDGLKEAIITLRDNPALCEKLGRNGLKAAQNKYNWDAQKEELLNVYKTLEKNN